MASEVANGSGYQWIRMEFTRQQIVPQPAGRFELNFEEAFKTNFKSLYAYAYTMLKDEISAEEMVQNVFFKVWEKREQLNITSSLTAYLYRSVYHECLNYLKHEKVKATYQSHVAFVSRGESDNASGKVMVSELQQQLDKAMSELPQQCRTIFQMSRFEQLKYQEIADRLGLSVKTVENQMGKALKILRAKLVDYLPFLLMIVMHIKP